MSCSLDKWNYFHDRKNKKGIVVNTFTCDSDGHEPQLNVFVVDTPDNNDWHTDMEEIQEDILYSWYGGHTQNELFLGRDTQKIQECNCGSDEDKIMAKPFDALMKSFFTKNEKGKK
tara:strand:+ start:399 stop:746 length:348 start_codon:yes stop_codon:yes gene_type:complete